MTDQFKLPIVVSVAWPMKALAIGSMIFGAGLWVLSFLQGQAQKGSWVLFFFLLGFLLFVLTRSSIFIDEKKVLVTVPYGHFRIGWDEVTTIKTCGPYISLESDQKRVVLSLAFAGKNANAMIAFFNHQAEKRAIQVFVDVDFPLTHKNTWVGL